MLIDAHVHLPYPRGFGKHRSEALFRNVAEAIGFARSAGVTGMVFNTWLGVFCDTA
ncbi:MAG: amidohydrolase, partial [Lentisphaeria bacterium]|nr:amidohydrolase [Lentisphaeria bacterium]